MNRIALNFICKNESHIVENMLDSVKSMIDLIVAIDTGSTDETIRLIQDFGAKHDLPTFIFERPFDNFGNSRNHALEKLQSIVDELGWDKREVWGAFLDCDEVLHWSDIFSKDDLQADIYFVMVRGGSGSFTRQLFFRLAKDIRWKYPVHEMLYYEDPSITETVLDEKMYVFTQPTGASWKEGLATKFLHHANSLVKYIDEGNGDFRCYLYAGNSFMTAYSHNTSPSVQRELLLNARKYYTEALALQTKHYDDNILAQRRLGEIKVLLGDGWADTQQLFLDTYALDPSRAESISRIIDHYMRAQDWTTCYLYAFFAMKCFHDNKPTGIHIARTEDALYQWKLLFHYYLSAFHLGKTDEAISAYNQLLEQMSLHPNYFPEDIVSTIHRHSPENLSVGPIKAPKVGFFAKMTRWIRN